MRYHKQNFRYDIFNSSHHKTTTDVVILMPVYLLMVGKLYYQQPLVITATIPGQVVGLPIFVRCS